MARTDSPTSPSSVRGTSTLLHVGGPTTVLRLGGLTIVTDPTFDPPGDYPLPGGRRLTKLTPPAVPRSSIGPIDVALVSHDQHPDNLDTSGRALLADAPLVLSTPAAARYSPRTFPPTTPPCSKPTARSCCRGSKRRFARWRSRFPVMRP